MPEGDTIFRTADVLGRALLGGVLRRAVARPQPGLARVPDLSVLVGSTVETVEARGKHLLIGFSGGRWLRTHMRMRGSWHRYAPGERWRLPERRATCVLETESAVAVCFDAQVAELLTSAELERHAGLRALGPDPLAPSPDFAEAVRRLRTQASLPLGEALLDQRLLAGVGNIFKSEGCFAAAISPWHWLGELEDDELAHVIRTTRELMREAVQSGHQPRQIYGRADEPCPRCGTPLRSRGQGDSNRTTYWCPSCQS
jgi:endonuclease-8